MAGNISVISLPLSLSLSLCFSLSIYIERETERERQRERERQTDRERDFCMCIFIYKEDEIQISKEQKSARFYTYRTGIKREIPFDECVICIKVTLSNWITLYKSVNATIWDVGILLSTCALKSPNSRKRIQPKMICATFNVNPSTTIVSCFSTATPVMKRTSLNSIRSYFPLYDTIPNTTIFSSVGIWLLN